MTYEEAIRILHPDTTAEALAPLSDEEKWRNVDEACIVACDALRAQSKIVHCKECKHFRDFGDMGCRCEVNGKYVDTVPDGFCHKGVMMDADV